MTNKKELKIDLRPETTLAEVIKILDFIEQQYGDDTASIKLFSDLGGYLEVHNDEYFVEFDPKQTLVVPANNEVHIEIEDGY
jgi:hypothetical protein